MTSTNINVGLADGRLSSRVLKPPGGGHTDIFGVHQNEVSHVGLSQNTSANNKNIASAADIAKPLSNNVMLENGLPQVGDKQPGDENVKPVEEKVSPRRMRVPPGGFSSGLW